MLKLAVGFYTVVVTSAALREKLLTTSISPLAGKWSSPSPQGAQSLVYGKRDTKPKKGARELREILLSTSTKDLLFLFFSSFFPEHFSPAFLNIMNYITDLKKFPLVDCVSIIGDPISANLLGHYSKFSFIIILVDFFFITPSFILFATSVF